MSAGEFFAGKEDAAVDPELPLNLTLFGQKINPSLITTT